MSDDKVRPLMKAVADLPAHYTGLVLSVVNLLRGENSSQVALAVKQALHPPVSGSVTPVTQAIEVLLEDMESVTVVIDITVNPGKALKITQATTKIEGLWVDNAFVEILAKGKGIAPTSVTMKPCRLKVDINDHRIKNELPKEHEIDPTAFVHMLATELTRVRSGETSKVLSKDRLCLFYVAGLVVRVRWSSDASQWSVRVWKLDGLRWSAGRVVFSCN